MERLAFNGRPTISRIAGSMAPMVLRWGRACKRSTVLMLQLETYRLETLMLIA